MKYPTSQTAESMTIGRMAESITAEDLQAWPEHSKLAAIDMIAKYGLPDVVSSEIMIWKRNGDPLVIEKTHGHIGQAS